MQYPKDKEAISGKDGVAVTVHGLTCHRVACGQAEYVKLDNKRPRALVGLQTSEQKLPSKANSSGATTKCCISSLVQFRSSRN